jgi:hypothetical protein
MIAGVQSKTLSGNLSVQYKSEASLLEPTSSVSIYVKRTCDPVRREVLYNILIEFGAHLELVRPIKIFLTKRSVNSA